MTEIKTKHFIEITDFPKTTYALFYKNISGTWSIHPHIFLKHEDAEYIGSFYDTTTFIVHLEKSTLERINQETIDKYRSNLYQNSKHIIKQPKIKKVKMPK
jgi:hypothetical protein